ncbi:hypothetical protein PENSPDRAFT_691411 [Peniophora sp. CONT]|nr:hypothetical protein PENSPDRAFT_691411 [Peniophora sp. CONT]
MSSIMNRDGSHDPQKRREEEESTRAQTRGDCGAPDEHARANFTHGSNVGSSSSHKRDAVPSNRRTTTPTTIAVAGASNSTLRGAPSPTRISYHHSQNIQYGSAQASRTSGRGMDTPQMQATVPQIGNIPQTSAAAAPDPEMELRASADRNAHSQSPSARLSSGARRRSLQEVDDPAPSPSHDPLRTPPQPQPSPSRTPDAYMEVDEDAVGTPAHSAVPLPLPGPNTGVDEDDVEAEMPAADDFSSLRYPSYEGSPTGASHADVEMSPEQPPDSSTPHTLGTAPPLSASQIGATTTFARPVSPTLVLIDTAAAGPSIHPPPSPLPPPHPREPLFLPTTPSDEAGSANSQDSGHQRQSRRSSDSPKPGWPFFDPDKPLSAYPRPRDIPPEAPDPREETEEQTPAKDIINVMKPLTAKKPMIRGKPGSSGKRKLKRHRVDSSESSEEYEEPARWPAIKKPRIAGLYARGEGLKARGKGEVSTTKVNARSTNTNAGPENKIVSMDVISITSDSAEDSPPPAQTSHPPKPSKRAPLSDIGANSDSDIEVIDSRAPGRDSGVEESLIPALNVNGPVVRLPKRLYGGGDSASKQVEAELKVMQWLGQMGPSGSKTHTSESVDAGPSNKPQVGPPKRRPNLRQSKLPVAPEPMSAHPAERSQDRAGPSRHHRSRKRKAAAPPSEAGVSAVVEISADPTKLFKMGSRVPPSPPRRKRVWRKRIYVGASPLPSHVARKLWFPHSRQLKFSAEEPEVAVQTGAFVGDRKPKFKEGPMSEAQIAFMENYPFSDEEFGVSESEVHEE